METDNKKRQVFWAAVNKRFFVKMASFRNIGKHYLCLEGKKTRTFVDTICFGKFHLFLWAYKITKHYKNWGFSRHRGKPKMALLVAKVTFWEWLLANMQKGFFWCFLCFLGGFVFFSLSLCLFRKKAQKGYFPAVLEFLFSILFPRRPVFWILLFFLFCYFSLFSFCLPFQNSIFCLCFLSINPIWKTLSFGDSSVSIFYLFLC